MYKNILVLLVFLLGIEYVNLGLSIYQLLILPISLLVCLILLREKIGWDRAFLVYVGYLIIKIILSLNNNDSLISLSVGLSLPFVFALYFLMKHEGTLPVIQGLTWFDVPNIAYALWNNMVVFGITQTDTLRFQGLHYDSNFVTIYLNLAIFSRLVLPPKKNFWKIFNFILILFDISFVLASNSRTGFIVLCFIGLLVLWKKLRLRSLVLIASSVIMLAAPFINYVNQLPEFTNLADNSIDRVLIRFKSDRTGAMSNRGVFWNQIIEDTKEAHWVTPIGLANFLKHNKYSHNNILDELIVVGPVFCTLMLILIIYRFGLCLHRMVRRHSESAFHIFGVSGVIFLSGMTLSFTTFKIWQFAIILLLYEGYHYHHHKESKRLASAGP